MGAPVDALLVRLPGAQIPRAREDARARARPLEDYRPQQPHQLGEQPHRDDGRVAELGVEGVLVLEPDPIADALAFCPFVRLGHELRIDIDAAPAQLRVHLRRGQRDQAVTGAEVDHDVVVAQGGELEHALDALGRAGLEERETLLAMSGQDDAENEQRDEGGNAIQHRSIV